MYEMQATTRKPTNSTKRTPANPNTKGKRKQERQTEWLIRTNKLAQEARMPFQCLGCWAYTCCCIAAPVAVPVAVPVVDSLAVPIVDPVVVLKTKSV